MRASALGDASRALAELAQRGLRTICFAKSRKAAELIHRFAADRLDPATAARLAPYRAGYQQRREIERRLVEGDLLGVSATDALELGIDIGLLDCAISVGFPGTMASLRQQWGRAGRRGHGLAVLVASEDALDQYFMRQPETLIDRQVEAAILDDANPRVLDGHVRAAAFEAPIDDADRATLGDEALERAAEFPLSLKHTPRGWVWAGARLSGRARPAPLETRLVHRRRRRDRLAARPRGTRARVLDGARRRRVPAHGRGATLVEESTSRTTRTGRAVHGRLVHAGEEGDHDRDLRAAPRRATARDGGDVRPGGRHRAGRRVPAQSRSATSRRSTWSGSSCRSQSSRPRRSGTSRNRSKPQELEREPRLLGKLHAAEHAMIAILPLWAMCDRWDIGGLSTNIHPQTGRPTIFVYDGHSRRDQRARLRDLRRLGRGHRPHAAGCPCEHGCPSCVQSPKCGNLNEPLDKHGALTFLGRLVDFPSARSS